MSSVCLLFLRRPRQRANISTSCSASRTGPPHRGHAPFPESELTAWPSRFDSPDPVKVPRPRNPADLGAGSPPVGSAWAQSSGLKAHPSSVLGARWLLCPSRRTLAVQEPPLTPRGASHLEPGPSFRAPGLHWLGGGFGTWLAWASSSRPPVNDSSAGLILGGPGRTTCELGTAHGLPAAGRSACLPFPSVRQSVRPSPPCRSHSCGPCTGLQGFPSFNVFT